jgi:hypothetical protein
VCSVSEDVGGICRRQKSIARGVGVLYIMEITKA